MITHIIIKMYCKRRVQIHDLQGIFTVCSRRSRTASYLTPSRGGCFEHIQNKRRRMAFYAIAFSVFTAFPQQSTALLATAQRAPRRSATFLTLLKRCEDTALFDRAFSSNVYYEACHVLVSCLVSPRESKNPVIKK